MLRVDREYLYALTLCCCHDYIATNNQGLLVGKGYALATLNSKCRRVQTSISHEGIHERVATIALCHVVYLLVARKHLDVGICECLLELRVVLLVAYDHALGLKLTCLLGKLLPTAVGHE